MKNAPLIIREFVDAIFGENAYVVSCKGPQGRHIGWVIDPGLGQQSTDLLDYIAAERIAVEKIVLTHGHADHIAGLDSVKEAHPAATVWIAQPDRPMLTDPALNLSAPFGFNVVVQTPATDDLAPGVTLQLGDFAWDALDTSGHSPGGRALYCPKAGVAFSGDSLFAGSVGRTDFPGGDHDRLIGNIRRHLLALPPATTVYSGHGPPTTIENERKSNPFLADA